MLQRKPSTFSLDVVDSVLAYDEHSSRKPVSWAEYKRLLTVSEKGYGYLTGYVQNKFRIEWMDGLVKIRKMLGEWGEEEGCVFCSVEDLLFDERRLPWLAGLLWEGELEVYNRSLRCMEYWGDRTTMLDTWIHHICQESRAAVIGKVL
jgi:hypothetical protein